MRESQDIKAEKRKMERTTEKHEEIEIEGRC